MIAIVEYERLIVPLVLGTFVFLLFCILHLTSFNHITIFAMFYEGFTVMEEHARIDMFFFFFSLLV